MVDELVWLWAYRVDCQWEALLRTLTLASLDYHYADRGSCNGILGLVPKGYRDAVVFTSFLTFYKLSRV